MPEHNLNDQVISEWREGWAGTLAPDALVNVFERALDALWRRAHISLGQLTLMAIVDRVLHQGAEKYPHLSALKSRRVVCASASCVRRPRTWR